MKSSCSIMKSLYIILTVYMDSYKHDLSAYNSSTSAPWSYEHRLSIWVHICPDYLKNYVSYTSDISYRDTRSTNCYQLYNCELFRKSFMYSGAAIWKSLPLHVKNATSVNTFKSLYIKWKRLNDHW